MPIPTINQLNKAFAYDPDANTVNTIPDINNNAEKPNLASFQKGFPSITMPINPSSGLPPEGQDLNGILKPLSELAVWYSVGGGFSYNGTFYNGSNNYISGYPAGARVKRTDNTGYWLNTVDDNQTDPESPGATGWQPDINTALTTITFTSNGQASYILNKNEAGREIFFFENDVGITPASTIEITLPAEFTKKYYIRNTTNSTLDIKTDNSSPVSNIVRIGPNSCTLLSVLSASVIVDLNFSYAIRAQNAPIGFAFNSHCQATGTDAELSPGSNEVLLPLVFAGGQNYINNFRFTPPFACYVQITAVILWISPPVISWRSAEARAKIGDVIIGASAFLSNDNISTQSIRQSLSISHLFEAGQTLEFVGLNDAQTSTMKVEQFFAILIPS